MKSQNHIVSGLYASRAEAEKVRSQLIEQGLPRQQVKVIERARADDNNRKIADDDAVLKEVLIDGALGTAVGTGLGALGEVALVAASVTLFAASPLIAPLAMLGWGAVLGGILGATAGANKVTWKKGKFNDLMLYAIRSGHVTLVAETRGAAEKTLASRIIGDSLTEQHEQRAA